MYLNYKWSREHDLVFLWLKTPVKFFRLLRFNDFLRQQTRLSVGINKIKYHISEKVSVNASLKWLISGNIAIDIPLSSGLIKDNCGKPWNVLHKNLFINSKTVISALR